MSKKVLVISPHSDDELYGAGGTLLKHKDNGDHVYGILICGDDEIRVKEYKKGMNEFGVKSTKILNFENAKLDVVSIRDLVNEIESYINEIKPDVLYIPAVSVHQDHTVTNEACIIACRPTAKYIPAEIYEYENPTYELGITKKFNPNFFINITNKINMKKKIFIKCYKSQNNKPFNNPLSIDKIIYWARFRGIQAGVDYAEAFQVVKIFK